jgi:hypothetical protein
MATTTYEPLQTITVSGTSTGQIDFTSISSAYTDLVVVANYGISANLYGLRIRFNSDTGSNYSDTALYGDGGSAVSSRDTSATSIITSAVGVSNNVLNYNFICSIQNYSNSTTYKTALVRANAVNREVVSCVGLWRSTSAISSVNVFVGSGYILAGSTFTLYGIANADIVSPLASGGTIIEDSTYYYHTFGMSGVFTAKQSLTADILVIAGGGAGGYGDNNNWENGGGGAGGLLNFSSQSLTATAYTVTVGAGGASTTTSSVNGGNSQFGALTAAVGGGAGGTTNAVGSTHGGLNGGSGGGGSRVIQTAGLGTAGQGNNGASYGGGGGAGAAASGFPGGNGTNAYSSWASATNTGVNGYYAGGGGGNGNAGGLGGGGNSVYQASTNGTAYTGSGGGAAGYGVGGGYAGANGGSGLVIVRYPKA